MTAVNFSNSVLKTDVLTWTSDSPVLQPNAFSYPSDPLDNTANGTQTPISWTRCLVRLSFADPQPIPDIIQRRIGLALLPLLDGVHIITPPGMSNIRPASGIKFHEAAMRSSQSLVDDTYAVVDFGDVEEGIKLGPFKYAFQLYNGSNLPWTEAPTVTVYRWNLLSA